VARNYEKNPSKFQSPGELIHMNAMFLTIEGDFAGKTVKVQARYDFEPVGCYPSRGQLSGNPKMGIIQAGRTWSKPFPEELNDI